MLIESLRKMQEALNDVVEEMEANKDAFAKLEQELPVVTVEEIDTKCQVTERDNWCNRPAGHCGDHMGNGIIWQSTPKWRQLVEKQSTFAKPPLADVLYNMYLCTEDYFLLNRLAHIVAVCERQVPGWKAEPYNSDGFSVYRLVSAFKYSLTHIQPNDNDWKTLGNEAASWLKQLTEADDD
jgi:hypothetical protein